MTHTPHRLKARLRHERGSAAALTLGSAAIMMLLVPILMGVILAYRAQSRADGVADLAAIAAAQAVQAHHQDPCSLASRVAALNHSNIATCSVHDDESVLISVREPRPQFAGLALPDAVGHALAGPASLAAKG